ncbi:dna-directed rna polymerase ii subunit rpb1 [Trichoderma cornu-damae]|uniref:Dna-directed rna polymerase ii subunit rpb1 n=1 Tax=Trichoderma cornu-damae TaxID=654480 RepID=A0A9P8TY68_9HYPO|nr:dna-directed rna polymerase ii subunit rpb1 [Trichoderma cornu-damae]
MAKVKVKAKVKAKVKPNAMNQLDHPEDVEELFSKKKMPHCRQQRGSRAVNTCDTMNAHALLSAQGWRGTGHSLHKTDDSIGLAKPLLLNRKTNTKGLGNTKHFTSDLWWMNAFDEQLKGLDTSREGQVVQTVKTGKLNALDQGRVSKYSVYASFVRGGFLEGTISAETTDDSTSTESDKSDKKKTESTRIKTAKSNKDSKEEKRARKEEKRMRKEARALRRAAKLERRLRRAGSKKGKSDSSSSVKAEKLLRRARREEKRKRKELEKKKASGG